MTALWIGLNCLKTAEPPCGESLLLITKYAGVPGTNLINQKLIKRLSQSWSHLVVLNQDPWIGNAGILGNPGVRG